MIFEISHDTRYTYSEKVFFEPHTFRFRPKNTPYSDLQEYSVQIIPEPSGLSEQLDIEGNHLLTCWFENTHQDLVIKTRSSVEVSDYNPYNFLVYPAEFLSLPFSYSQRDQLLLYPSLSAHRIPDHMKDFLNTTIIESGHQTITFLSALNNQIHREFVLESREFGSPHQPEITFKQRRGSCRDLAWMHIHLLRHTGIAARFVSGYFYPETNDPEFELHAWVEAYIPGAGWLGFDPGHGIVTGNRHIPVAASSVYEHTMPVSGSVRGKANAHLKTDLHISVTR